MDEKDLKKVYNQLKEATPHLNNETIYGGKIIKLSDEISKVYNNK